MRSMENEECGKTRSMENTECGKCKVWKIRSVDNAEYGKCRVCGNALTLTDLSISKHFNTFIQHKKCLEMFYS